MSPSLEIGIGMGYVRSDLAEPGTPLEVDVRGLPILPFIGVEFIPD